MKEDNNHGVILDEVIRSDTVPLLTEGRIDLDNSILFESADIKASLETSRVRPSYTRVTDDQLIND